MNTIYLGDNLPILHTLPDASADLIYIDPPFNTGHKQARTRLKTERAADGQGDRTGFAGRRYTTTRLGQQTYADSFDDYEGFLRPRLEEARRVLAADGTLYFHIDYREVHYCKVLLDQLFGRASFLNEIIWAYDYGARTRKRWPAKHDNILVYVKDPANYVFNVDDIDRIPYMAPGLVGPEKAARGKLPTDCYSADTDILTRRGWLAFTELRPADEVATVSPEGELTYTRPTKLHSYSYQGEMLEFSTKTVNLLVTPNHHLYLRPKHQRQYSFISADQVCQQYYALRNQLEWRGETPETYRVPPVDYRTALGARPLPEFYMADWCEFMGWYLSEGSTSLYRDRKEVIISQRHPEQRAAIANLLDRMGLTYQVSAQGFVICNKQLALHLKQFGKAHEKFIPRELISLAVPFLERLYDGLMQGDGNKKGESWTYFTTSKQLAGDVQELLIKLGCTANISESVSSNPNWRVKYCVSRRTARESTIFPKRHLRRVTYDGMVYCCTVEPFHTLVVRRRGKPAICGNCWWHTIVSPTGKEKTGYPTQKPVNILKRIVAASSPPGGTVLDFFAGSGTTGAAAHALGRSFTLVDNNPQALAVMRERFKDVAELEVVVG